MEGKHEIGKLLQERGLDIVAEMRKRKDGKKENQEYLENVVKETACEMFKILQRQNPNIVIEEAKPDLKASKNGFKEKLSQKNRENLKEVNRDGTTQLWRACHYGHKDMVEMIPEKNKEEILNYKIKG